jgi:hypothetical protein
MSTETIEIDVPTQLALRWFSTMTGTLYAWRRLGGEERLQRVWIAMREAVHAASALPFANAHRSGLLTLLSLESENVNALRPYLGARGMGAA